jgi:hypothetical protein
LYLKVWIKYGLLNSLIGLIIGTHTAITAIGDGYYVFGIAAPIAAFFTGGLLWRLIVKDKLVTIRIVITGLLTGTISHYVTFMLLSIQSNICYWTSGGCTDSLGGPPASIMSMLTGAFGFSFFSLLFYGWITAPSSVIIGLILKWTENKKKSHKEVNSTL